MRASQSIFRRKHGFTLLEVMLATALFVSAVSVLIVAYVATLDAVDRVQVNQSLEQDLTMIRQQALLLSDLDEIEKGGEVVTGQHGLARWEMEVEPTEIADLFHVTLIIALNPKDEEGLREAQQQFYLTRPTWSDPVDRSELRARTKDQFLEKQSQMRQ